MYMYMYVHVYVDVDFDVHVHVHVYVYVYVYVEAYAIPPTPLEVAPDFPWMIRFSEYYSQRFQRQVRQLISLSDVFTEV